MISAIIIFALVVLIILLIIFYIAQARNAKSIIDYQQDRINSLIKERDDLTSKLVVISYMQKEVKKALEECIKQVKEFEKHAKLLVYGNDTNTTK